MQRAGHSGLSYDATKIFERKELSSHPCMQPEKELTCDCLRWSELFLRFIKFFALSAIVFYLADCNSIQAILATAFSSHTVSTAKIRVTPVINVNNTVTGALNATAWALIYSYPLYIFGNFAGSVLENVQVNQIFHQTALAAIGNSAVIKPNVDTVYSRVVLDLSTQDLVLTIPNITDRYWLYPIYDPYGNVIAEIGAVNKNKPGNYLIRRADDVLGPAGLQNVSDYLTQVNAANAPKNGTQYAGIVNLPTTHGTMLIRLLVLENTTADFDIIHGYQNASKLISINRTTSLAPSPYGNLSSLAPNGSLLGIDTPEKLLSFASEFVLYNQPELYSERQRVAGILGAAGIYDGQYIPQTGVDVTLAAAVANASIAADVSNSTRIRDLGNDWQLSIASYQGNYGCNYGSRAYVAIYGYQQLTVAQTLYPGFHGGGFTSEISLPVNSSLLITFSGKLPVLQEGFWSLTVYGEDQWPIPNSLNRFEVGDRLHSLKYQGNDEFVYGPKANAAADGPFQVLVQPAHFTPPANWSGNWLPAAQNFSFITRWYVPSASLTNGSYVYPVIQTISAIV